MAGDSACEKDEEEAEPRVEEGAAVEEELLEKDSKDDAEDKADGAADVNGVAFSSQSPSTKMSNDSCPEYR